MTLTDTLDHLLSVFLRPLRTWIEREFIPTFRSSYGSVMQTKVQYRDGVYLHLKERLEGTEEKPLAEGVPVRPLPQTQDLAHLQSAVELLGERKIEDASPDIPDGVSFERLIGDNDIRNLVTRLVDTNEFEYIRENTISDIINLFPNLAYLEIHGKRLNTHMTPELFGYPDLQVIVNFSEAISRGDYRLFGGLTSSIQYSPKSELHLPKLREGGSTDKNGQSPKVGKIYLDSIERGMFRLSGSASWGNTYTTYVYLGCKGNVNDIVNLETYNDNSSVIDIEIGEGARQTIILGKAYNSSWHNAQFVGLTEENIREHILKRLAPNDDLTITITIGSTNLAKLTSPESIEALDWCNANGYTIV